MVEGATTRDRRSRARSTGAPRHRSGQPGPNFATSFTSLGELAYDGARVSASVLDLDTGESLLAIDDRISLPTASIGRILLLIEVAARISERDGTGYGILDKTQRDLVGDAGLWQHLQAPSLPVADLATLVGASGDNLATNALLRHVGLDAVRVRTEGLGLQRTALLDLARDSRGPDDAPQLSIGSVAELTWLFSALAHGQVVDQLTSSRVLGWLSLNADLSLVASAFGLDPLAHRGTAHGLTLVNTTGTDEGIRSEAGLLRGPRAGVAYAVSLQFNDDGIAARLRTLDALRAVGLDILEYVA